MASRCGSLLWIAVIVAFIRCSFGKTLTVGGESVGWTFPPSPAQTFYDDWAKNQSIFVGDILFFEYNSSAHNVYAVSQASLSSCNTSNPITEYTQSNASVTLTTAGNSYFICGYPGHCGGGMKMTVTVLAAETPAPAPSPSGLVPAPVPVGSPRTPATVPSPSTPSPTPAPTTVTPAPTPVAPVTPTPVTPPTPVPASLTPTTPSPLAPSVSPPSGPATSVPPPPPPPPQSIPTMAPGPPPSSAPPTLRSTSVILAGAGIMCWAFFL